MMPDLDALLDLTHVAHQWEEAGTLPEQTLSIFQRWLPSVRGVSFEAAPPALPPAPTFNQTQNTWLVPLRHSGRADSALHVAVDSSSDDAPPTTDATQTARVLQLAGEILALGLPPATPTAAPTAADEAEATPANLQSQQEIQTLYALSDELLKARDGLEILFALRKHLAPNAAMLGLFAIGWDRPTRHIRTYEVLYEVDACGDYRTGIDLMALFSPETINALEQQFKRQGQEIAYLEDNHALQDAYPIARIAVQQGHNSGILIPIYDEDWLVQQIHITFEQPQSFDDHTRRLFNTARDQISILMQNRRLLQRTGQSLQEARTLYEMNRELLISKTSLDVLRVVRTHLAQDAQELSLMEIKWQRETHELIAVTQTARIDKTGEHQLAFDIPSFSDPQRIPTYLEEWRIQGRTIDFIEDLAAIVEERPASRYALEVGFRSMVVIPIYDGDWLVQQFNIAYTEPQTFDRQLRRLFEAIRDQMTLVLQNRILLEQTESSLYQIGTLYATNSRLIQAKDHVEVVTALYETLAPDANGLSLATIEWDNGDEVPTAIRGSVALNAKRNPKQVETVKSDRNMLDNVIEQGMLDDLLKEWAYQGRDVEFIEDLETIMEERPIAQISYRFGIRSMVIMPIYEGNVMVQQININYDQPRTFSLQERRLFEAIRDQVSIVLQNHNLIDAYQRAAAELQQQVQVLQTINHISVTLASIQEEDLLLQMACQSLHLALKVDHVGIALTEAPQSHRAIVSYEYPPEGMVGRQITTDPSVVYSREPIIINAIETETRLGEITRQSFQQIGVKAVILAPLLDVNGQYVGSIGLDLYTADREFTMEDMQIVRSVANQVSSALQTLRLINSTQRQAQQMEEIAKFSQSLQRTLALKDLLQVSAESMLNVIESDSLNVMLYDLDSGQLQTIARQQVGGQLEFDLDGLDGIETRAHDRTTALKVWQSKSPLQFHDLSAETDLHYTLDDGVQSVLAAPIFARNSAIGLVEVGRIVQDQAGDTTPYNRPYSQIEYTLFLQFVSQLSVALENAQAYHQSQRLARSKVIVNEITDQLQQQVEMQQLLDVTLKEVGQALGARKGRIRLDITGLKTSADEHTSPSNRPNGNAQERNREDHNGSAG